MSPNLCTKILPYTTDGEVAILLDSTYIELNEDLYDEMDLHKYYFDTKIKTKYGIAASRLIFAIKRCCSNHSFL